MNEIERAAGDGLTPDEAAMPKARSVFEELAPLLGEQPFFAGEAISLADLLVAPQLAFFRMTPGWEVLSATRRRREGYSHDTILNFRSRLRAALSRHSRHDGLLFSPRANGDAAGEGADSGKGLNRDIRLIEPDPDPATETVSGIHDSHTRTGVTDITSIAERPNPN